MKNYFNYLITLVVILFSCAVVNAQNSNSRNSSTPLSGTYTIGAGGDYTTINSAVSDLVSNGVNGAVVFNILTGSYDEQVTITSFTGSSSLNTVTFQSQTLNSNDVIWYSSNTSSPFTLKIDGADYLTIQKITFSDNNASPNMRSRILFSGNCDGINILNNVLSGGITNDYGFHSSGALFNNLVIDGNSVNVAFGLAFQELVLISSNTKITNNNFDCNNVIEIYNHNDLLIEKNNLSCTAVTSFSSNSPSCIRSQTCNGNLRILKNKLKSVSVNFAADGIAIDSYTGPSALVANNFVSLQTGTGIWVSDCINVNIYFNTIRTAAVDSGDITFVVCSNVNSKNNIMVNLGNFGQNSLTYYLILSSFGGSDYNDFYYTNNTMLYHTIYGYVTNLTQFRNLSGLETHSIEHPVNFVSNTDLHLNGSSIGDRALVGTPIAGITDDIDGQPRNPQYPYMGADESDAPLPVNLVSFTSVVNGRDVTLNWKTLQEINNYGFDIQRSAVINQTPEAWSSVGFVNGNGTHSAQSDYTFTDYGLTTGKYKYRLKQIDLNGNFEYFNLGNEVNIGIANKFELSQNYPNPFNPTTKIDFNLPDDGNVKIKVFDMTGKEVKTLLDEQRTAGYYTVDFNGSDLSSGIYYYTLESGSFKETKKMIMLK
jgi:Secretion system C-terminal sorting domain